MRRNKKRLLAIGKDEKGHVEVVPTHLGMELLEAMPNPESVVFMYCPSLELAHQLVESGVKRVFYMVSPSSLEGAEYLRSNGVEVARVGAGELIQEVR